MLRGRFNGATRGWLKCVKCCGRLNAYAAECGLVVSVAPDCGGGSGEVVLTASASVHLFSRRLVYRRRRGGTGEWRSDAVRSIKSFICWPNAMAMSCAASAVARSAERTRTRTRAHGGRKRRTCAQRHGHGQEQWDHKRCSSPRPHEPAAALPERAGWPPVCVSARLCLTQGTEVGLVCEQRARALLKRLPALRVLLHARQGLGQLGRHRQFLWGKRTQQRAG